MVSTPMTQFGGWGLGLSLAAVLVGGLLWYRRRWRSPWREVVVWPGDPLAAGEDVRLVFEGRRPLRLGKRRDGSYGGHLHRDLLERPFTVCRFPGRVPEVGFHGQDMPPRAAASITQPLWIFPAAWHDRGPHDARLTRVGRHEDHVIAGSPRLPGDRTVRVHLPASYEGVSGRPFPVVYLLDGQNVFDASTAYGGVEWCIDEIAHRFEAAGEPAPILVGIDNGGVRRVHEYTFCRPDGRPYEPAQVAPPAPKESEPATGRAESRGVPDGVPYPPVAPPEEGGGAEEHLAFILEEVVPLIRTKYHVEDGPGALIGSSLGGLFALWAALAHPEAFRAVAAVSPSIWWGKGAILKLATSPGRRPRVWLCLGTNEGEGAAQTFELARSRLDELGWREGEDFAGLLVAGAHHHESAWADRSPTILRFLRQGD